MAGSSSGTRPPKTSSRTSSKLNLEDLLLDNVEITRESLGSLGSYGKVSKALYYGSPCAAKEFHHSWTSSILNSSGFDSKGNPKTQVTREFMKECLRCAKLRHPNVVQFLGVYYKDPGSAGTIHGPVLIMEKMGITLKKYLSDNRSIEMSCKLSILLDISQGLMYLHSRDPQIIHGGLTSQDVFLTDSTRPQAKISGDPNVFCVLLKQPGTTKPHNKDLVEFLPHLKTQQDCHTHDSSLDIFSYGGIMLHTITQEWPKPKEPLHSSSFKSSGGKSSKEIERRSEHIKKIRDHFLEQLIISCLDDNPKARPLIAFVHKSVKNAISHLQEPALMAAAAKNSTTSAKTSQKDKLKLKSKAEETQKRIEQNDQEYQQKDVISQQKDREIEQKTQEIQQKNDIIQQKEREIEQKNQEIQQKDKIIQQKDREIDQKTQESKQKDEIIQQKDREIDKKPQESQQKDKAIQQKYREIEQKTQECKQKDEIIQQKDRDIGQKIQESQQKDEIIQQNDKEIKQKTRESQLKDKIISQKNNEIEQKVQECQEKDKIIQQQVKKMKQQKEEIQQKNELLVHIQKQLNEAENELRELKLQQGNIKNKSELQHTEFLLSSKNKLQHTETEITKNAAKLQHDTENQITKKEADKPEGENEIIKQNDRQIEQRTGQIDILIPAIEMCKIDNLSNHAIANKTVSPVVTLKNIQERPIINCGDSISVFIQPSKCGEATRLPANVAEIGNGQYKVSFNIKEAGDHNLVILVGNQSIIQPPFRIHCIQCPQEASGYGSQMRVIKPLRNSTCTSCYFNSVLQVLNQTAEFVEMILKYRESDKRSYLLPYENKNADVNVNLPIELSGVDHRSMVSKIMWFLKEVEDDANHIIDPYCVLNQLTENSRQQRFGQHTQEDSHELLRYLLYELKKEETDLIKDGVFECMGTNAEYSTNPDISKQDKLIIKSLLRSASKEVTTPIDKVFGGVKLNTVICRECQTPLQTYEPFFDISLGVPDIKQSKTYGGGRGRGCYSNTHGSHWQPHQSPAGQSTYQVYGQTAHGQTAYGPHYTGHPRAVGNQNCWGQRGRTNTMPNQSSYIGRPRRDERKPEVPVTYDKVSIHELLTSKNMYYQPVSDKHTSDIDALDDVQISLGDHTEIDNMDEHNKFICTACTEKKGTMTDDDIKLCFVAKQILIHQLPQVLIIHFKRFDIGTYTVTKDSKHVSFSPILNMAPYCSNKCLEDFGDAKGEIIYGLYGVVEHMGMSLQSGHYTAYVRRRPERQNKFDRKPDDNGAWIYDRKAAHDGKWFHTSDLTVRDCWDFQEVKGCKAYMLFYERLPWVAYGSGV